MKTSTKQKKLRRLASGSVFGILALGLASPAHAQECELTDITKLLAFDGVTQDSFGEAVSISGDTAVVGAPIDDDNGFNSGSVYVFTRSGGAWTLQEKITASDGQPEDFFGLSVSISGDTIVVGAHADDDNGLNAGSAYIYTRSGGVWTQQAKLLAVDPGGIGDGDVFGGSVFIDGDNVVIGAQLDDDLGTDSGSAYIFTRSGNMWSQVAKLRANMDGAPFDRFAHSVAIDGDTVVIGSYYDDDNGFNSGSAYIFSYIAGQWTQQAKLLPTAGGIWEQFGKSVSVSGDTVVVGSQWDGDNGSQSGSATIYTRSGGVWTEEALILPADGGAGDRFGFSVAVSGDIAFFGAIFDDENGPSSGSGYVFARVGGLWTEQAKILPAGGTTGDWFGRTVSFDGDTAIFGMIFDDDNGEESGSAYIYSVECGACPVDMNSDGTLNFVDVSAFVAAFQAGSLTADFNGDGTLNFVDVSTFVAAFQAGCP